MSLPFISGRGNRGGSFAAGPAAPVADTGVTRQDDLVAWYKMDEESGSTVSDSSSNGYDLTATNMDDDDWIAGKNGNALNFDGSDDYAVDGEADKTICNAMNGSATASSQGPWSVSFWLKKESNTASGIFSIANSTVNGNPWLLCRSVAAGSDHKLGFFAISSSPWYIYTDTWTADSGWHNIVCTFSGSVWKTYRNGSAANTATKEMRRDNSRGFKLRIGESWPAWGSAKALEDFRLYNIELDSDDVTAIYNSGTGDW